MDIKMTHQQQQAELHSNLWSIANDLRGQMEANEFKNYILGLIFYRYLSEKTVMTVNNLLVNDNITFENAWQDEDYKEAIVEALIKHIGYVIEPSHLFDTLVKHVENQTFSIEQLQIAINSVTESTLGTESEDDFNHLFDDMDLNSSKLGRDVSDRSHTIGKIIVKINLINFNLEDSEIDVLGDAYEYLISQFAANAGKKAGEFYTPQQVSKILAKIVTVGKENLRNVYDPTCGSGSLLLRVAKESNVRKFFGQEKIATTYNLARMNMLLHNVRYDNFDIRNDDTLENPYHINMKFEAIVANPPYSAKWSSDAKFLDDERFANFGKLAPKSKADFAFIQHMFYQLEENGVMAVVLPHGVLFRGAAEGVIREQLIKNYNCLDAVIGLPVNIFFGTSIPTAILVFKKNRQAKDILFIDASNEFEKSKNQNFLTDNNVSKIIETYINRETIEKFSAVVDLDEIESNDYNLNIPRYVDTFEVEEEIDLDEVNASLKLIDEEIEQANAKLEEFFKELGI